MDPICHITLKYKEKLLIILLQRNVLKGIPENPQSRDQLFLNGQMSELRFSQETDIS